MHHGNLDRSIPEHRVLHSLFYPLELSLAETVEVYCSRILRSTVRLVLTSVDDQEGHRTLAEQEIRLACRSRTNVLKHMSLAAAGLMIASCIDGRNT